MKKTIELVLCTDCVMAASANCYEGLEPERAAQVAQGLRSLGAHLVEDEGREQDVFSYEPCGCCGSTLGGFRDAYCILEK